MGARVFVWLVAGLAQALGEVAELSKAEAPTLAEALEKHEVLLVKFYQDWCVYCRDLGPGYLAAAQDLRLANSRVVLAQTRDLELQKEFGVQRIPAVLLFRKGQLQYQHWAFDRDDIFDFARTFDFPLGPVGSVVRSHYWLRSLVKFGVKALLKTLRLSPDHPLQLWMPKILGRLGERRGD
ncbi:unnamed protein product [Effrenium voratum]|uniref:Thioredoxin domain-containing protein n=1 Tax=Effrenium voratum TaxID=2562239 RepID=A0AA36N161_9DINO|nr:unnamed protein product [Effrenium voratum]